MAEPLNAREKILIEYACILGVFGEDSKQANDFCAQHDDISLFGGMTETVITYRYIKEQVSTKEI